MSETTQTDRFVRQSDLVPLEKLKELKPVTVIGVGAVGRQIAMQLAAIGAPSIKLIDFDIVDLSNVTTQGYNIEDVGKHKVNALAEAIKRYDPSIEVEAVCDQFRDNMRVGIAAFCCVDSITVRRRIWDCLSSRLVFWGDGRMLGETIRVLTVASPLDGDKYVNTLFDQATAEVGRCTARSTIYASTITAGLMIHQFTRWLRGLPVTTDLLLNLLADEMIIDCEAPGSTFPSAEPEVDVAEPVMSSSA